MTSTLVKFHNHASGVVAVQRPSDRGEASLVTRILLARWRIRVH